MTFYLVNVLLEGYVLLVGIGDLGQESPVTWRAIWARLGGESQMRRPIPYFDVIRLVGSLGSCRASTCASEYSGSYPLSFGVGASNNRVSVMLN